MKRNFSGSKEMPRNAVVRLTPIAAAAGLLVLSASYSAMAQDATVTSKDAKADEPQTVQVQGIRAALQQSLTQKKNADSHVEVITAEDIGKMPDKNVADSLERVPGVTVSNAGASEGGFDENDRVSMRGTNSNLTQTLINGHNVASGDWFVLNQTTQVGRSVSYTLVPSELVGSVVVHKSSEANLVEGGVAGSVDIITRKPLEFHEQVTAEASLGAVYADLPKKTDPQFSALVNWKNDANTFGALLQVFSETRHLRRDGVEVLGYQQISPTSPMAIAHPDLSGAYYPGFIGAALFEQERKRQGGLLDMEFKPNRDFTFDVSGFSSKLDASNVNDNYLLNGGKTLTGATFAPVAGTQYNEYDQISRPGEKATSNFISIDGKWRATDALTIKGQAGTSKGDGETPNQDVIAWNGATGTGAAYQFNGVGSAPSFTFNNNPAASPGTTKNADGSVNSGFGWMFGDQNIDVKDKEQWGQLDGDFQLTAGPVNLIKFGVRAADHDRSSNGVVGQGPLAGAGTGPFAAAGGNYPGNFGSGLGGNIPQGIFYYTPDQLAAFAAQYANRATDGSREDWQQEFTLNEKTRAGYAQANFDGEGWGGNVGVRYVQTKEHAISNVGVQSTTPGAITKSAFGPFLPTTTDHTYNDWLPSANLKFDLRDDLVLRFALNKTMTRPDFSSLVGTYSLTPPPNTNDPTSIGSGTGGNPDLKPVRSTNFDTSLEYYFAPHSLVSASLYYMDLTNYIGQGTRTISAVTNNIVTNALYNAQYLVSSPINSTGKVKGLELYYQQPFFTYFGVQATGTLTDAVDDSGAKVLGSSKKVANISAYYEDEKYNARITYGYRSEAYVGLDRGTEFNQEGGSDVNASFGYQITKKISLALDIRNLNNPKLKYYALNEDQPRSIYENGRQFFLTMRMKY